MLSMVPNVIYVPYLAFSILFKLQLISSCLPIWWLTPLFTMLYTGKIVDTWKVLFLSGIQASWGFLMVSRKILTLYVILLSFVLKWGVILFPISYILAYAFWSFDSTPPTHTHTLKGFWTKLEFHLWFLLTLPSVCLLINIVLNSPTVILILTTIWALALYIKRNLKYIWRIMWFY